ncbi:MAG: BamA/TamA family outer membrane protein [Polyangiaceae bacterium]|nr:BamA/TamA family outer membrane protein [Polyangiaceae bacterium]
MAVRGRRELAWILDAIRVLASALMGCWLLAACAQRPAEKVPGETDIDVARVSVVPKAGTPDVSMAALLPKLGSRPSSALYTPRRYNPFRVAEDRRRIQSFLATQGYLDAVVDEARVQLDETKKEATIAFHFQAGPRYRLESLRIQGTPSGVNLDAFRRAEPGERYDLETLRVVRYDMAGALQREGYGHARVYVRTYVDREKKLVHVVYFCDPGPLTKVGRIRVEGTKRVAEADVRERLGLASGAPYSLDAKEKAEADLYDTGAFAQVVVETTADVEQYLGDVPDTGGVIDESRVDAEGNLTPRPLPDAIDLVVHVDEAPSAKVRLRGSAELDPTRMDLVAGAGVELRNALGSQHHLIARGRIGVGYLWRDDTDQPAGLYGDALLRYVRPGLVGRIGDGRLSARFRDVLYPGFHLRELTTGPGLRSTLAKGLFFDVDAFFRVAYQADFGPFSPAERARYALADGNTYVGADAAAALVWDSRNDPVEATRGHLLAARVLASPFGTQQYVQLAPEARGFIPLGDSFAIGAHASFGWVLGYGDTGVPLGPRLFGGGAFGMRGYGRDRLSPVAETCAPVAAGPPSCRGEYVGGLSLAEAKLELRFLPPQKQAGITIFTDAGGAGRRANPFEDGVQMAAGLGPRLRLWYVPISVDVSYRFMEQSRLADGGLRVFARIGEAF